jgi:hypothetical protein
MKTIQPQKIAVLLLFSVLSILTNAQTEKNKLSIVSLNNIKQNNAKVKQLTSEVNQAAYYENGELKIFGNSAPEILYIHAAELPKFLNETHNLKQVIMLQVSIPDDASLNTILSLPLINVLPSLKYLNLQCYYNLCNNTDETCKSKAIESKLPNGFSFNVTIIYSENTSN